uniref:Uncharacterized protein n=1 Tax=Aegilops tauschii subsp. strangulata TaxID=200361 RepID=A0A453PX13_AEGTS
RLARARGCQEGPGARANLGGMPASSSSSSPCRQALACGCAPPPAEGRNIGELFNQSMHMPWISPSDRRMTVSDELHFLLGNQASEFIPAVIKANQGFSASCSQSRSRMYASGTSEEEEKKKTQP